MNLHELPNLSTTRLKALKSIGVESPDDLLMLFPHRYVDKTRVEPIRSLPGTGDPRLVIATPVSIYTTGSGRKKRLEITFRDDTGELKGVWFRGENYFRNLFRKGKYYALFGSVRRFGRQMSMVHPEVEPLQNPNDTGSLKGIEAIYPGSKSLSRAKITHKLIRGWVSTLLHEGLGSEFLPASILKEENFPERRAALKMIHFPEALSEPDTALERFKFEELFLFELAMGRIRQLHFEEKQGPVFTPGGSLVRSFLEQLPFQLTEGQRSSLHEIANEVRSGKQMHRLLQGDVGAGKTVVAIAAMLMAVDSGYQATLMAPTEILAEQHAQTLTSWLSDLGVVVKLLTGGQKQALRRDILTSVEGGQCHITVGTHAIIQKDVRFHQLGLAVIDEQHRFGVKQRAEIVNKGTSPHLLVMSATPIPRSLALSIYSDLDISVVKGLPAGRKPVKTAVRTEKSRNQVYSFLEQSVRKGGQAYIVYPLIEESEALDLKDATMGYEKLQKLFPDLRIGLLHGRMDSRKKEQVMSAFYKGKLQILVSTTVIEVGVDVSNASVMIIEHAERFGLSQLHQLRGRIGRGDRESFCILIPGEKLSKEGRYRLKTMTETNDGFQIAEADLKLRGPGDFLGTKQSGLPEFRVADIVEDRFLLEKAKQKAWELIRNDPDLNKPGNNALKSVFEPYYLERLSWFELG
ncbi:MAG: ATP-dependent DNA helicase RecG [Balneolaceae bacterium]